MGGGGVQLREEEEPAVDGHAGDDERDDLEGVKLTRVVGAVLDSGDHEVEQKQEHAQRLHPRPRCAQEDGDEDHEDLPAHDHHLPEVLLLSVPSVQEPQALSHFQTVQTGVRLSHQMPGHERHAPHPQRQAEPAPRQGPRQVASRVALNLQVLDE